MNILIRSLLVLLVFTASAKASDTETFPLVVAGKTLRITSASCRPEIQSMLQEALVPDALSVSTSERIQYDFSAVEGEGPLVLMFDFDKRGKWVEVVIESFLKQQNPVAQELVGWLNMNAGPGRMKGKTRIWNHIGYAFRLKEVKNAGEDSVYSVTISRK